MYIRLILCILLFLVSISAKAVMFGLCPATPPYGVIPCDTGCTGAAAANMAAEFSAAEFEMATAFNDMNTLWTKATNADSKFLLTYMEKNLERTNQRITSYSATEAKFKSGLSVNSKERTALFDTFALALERASINKRSVGEQQYVGRHHGAGVAQTRIPQMLANSPLMSDPINNKSMHTELLLGWDNVISKYSSNEAETLVLTTDASPLKMIALGRSKLSISVSSEISKLLAFRHLTQDEKNDLSSNRQRAKDKLAIDLLLQSFDIDTLEGDAKTVTDISQDWFTSIETQQSISANKERDIEIDNVIGQAVENTLLNDYLNLKRRKNLVRALN